MASTQNFVDFILGQIENAGHIAYRKIFGEYALYCNNKVVALVCDDQLFVKATAAGRTFIGKPVEAPAYPGAKLSFLVSDMIDDREWLSELVRITEKELPGPREKKKKRISRGGAETRRKIKTGHAEGAKKNRKKRGKG
jgi:TfoX/Sxy family transcriptional regulator of competence genes